VSDHDVANEIRVLEKLCPQDKNRVLVHVFHQERVLDVAGYIPTLHLIDMELCLRNLNDEIMGQRVSLQDLLEHTTGSDISGKNTSKTFSFQIWSKNKAVVNILHQVLEGLQFIHSHDEVHRDLKPENGLQNSRMPC